MLKQLIPLTAALAMAAANVTAHAQSAPAQYSHYTSNLPFSMDAPSAPQFPSATTSVADHGATGDGLSLCTEAFGKAIAHLSSQGGGTLIVPTGIWLTGPITLQSNINLHLCAGAIILFSPDKSLYPLVETTYEGQTTFRCQSPINGRGLTNVAITGQGVIDGNGTAWRPLKRPKVTEAQWKQKTKGGVMVNQNLWFPSASYQLGDSLTRHGVQLTTPDQWNKIHDFLRPVMVSLVECTNVMLSGVTFQNSPAWNIHPLLCTNVIIDGVTIRNPSYAQNGDGLDLESCRNALVVNSTFDVGDDAICIKSGKDEAGRRRGVPCENVAVSGCTVYSGHGGFVVGSEMSGGVRNIHVSQCQFLGTDVGLRFKSCRGRGGVVENIYVSDISMTNIATEPLLFDLFYGGKSAVEALDDADSTTDTPEVKADITTPEFRNIYISGIRCNGARRAMYFNGLPEKNVRNIHLDDVVIKSTIGGELCESDGIEINNLTIEAKKGAALRLHNCKNTTIRELKATCGKHSKPVEITGRKSSNISY